ncbi:MAG: hypothetical protein JWP89_863 [Schlesneria sp.]|nr:hypothetical protein [Schlesneria sp.]
MLPCQYGHELLPGFDVKLTFSLGLFDTLFHPCPFECPCDLSNFGFIGRQALSRNGLASQSVLQSHELAIHRMRCEWSSGVSPEERTLRVFNRQTGSNFPRSFIQVDDPLSLFAFAVLDLEDPPRMCEIDMPGFDNQGFLRPAPRLPGDGQQFTECKARRVCEGVRILVGSDQVVPFAALGFLDMGNRGKRYVSLLSSPTETTLNGGKGSTLCPIGPSGMRVAPLIEVEWFEFINTKIPSVIQKRLDAFLIPLGGLECPVFAAPLDEEDSNGFDEVVTGN